MFLMLIQNLMANTEEINILNVWHDKNGEFAFDYSVSEDRFYDGFKIRMLNSKKQTLTICFAEFHGNSYEGSYQYDCEDEKYNHHGTYEILANSNLKDCRQFDFLKDDDDDQEDDIICTEFIQKRS